MTAPFWKRSIGGFTLKPKAQGFTLIELMISISIVAVLATVGFVIYSSAQRTARISRRIQDLKSIQTSLEAFKAATGKYPVVATAGICIEAGSNSLGSRTAFIPSFMQVVPMDPLNNGSTSCYKYQSADGSNYKLWTSGVPTSDMGDSDYRAQPLLIDPQADGTNTNCVVDAGTVTQWAVYSDRATCAY